MEKIFLAEVDPVANCLYDKGITIDTFGWDNIITDEDGKLWLVDIDSIDTPKRNREKYLASVHKYLSRLLGPYG